MDKLQLYITKSYDGFSYMTDFNADDAVKAQVTDITDAVKCISYNPEEKNIYYLLRSTDAGVFITLIRTIPAEIGDHLAAWLFVPSSASITSYDIEEAINKIAEIISNSKITSEALNTLRRLLGKEYETMQSPGLTVANTGSVYAHRFYGAGTDYALTDFIGTKRYQTSYLPYAGVILADRSKVSGIAGPDITGEPVEQMVRIFPPRSTVSPYRPNIFGRPFTKPYLVPLMGTVEIVWKSQTDPDVHQTIMVSQPNMRPEPITKSANTPAPAPAKGQTSLPVPPPQVAKAPDTTEQPAGAPADAPSPSQEKPEEKKVSKPLAPPAAPATQTWGKPQRPKVQNPAAPGKHNYVFKIAPDTAAVKGMIEFTVSTDGILDTSPIEGYVTDAPIVEGEDKSNHLKYSPEPDKPMLIRCGLVGLLAGILLTLLCVWIFSGSSGSTKSADAAVLADTIAQTDPAQQTQAEQDTASGTTAQQPAAGQAATAAGQGKTLQDAIKYLDGHESWSKTEMESYPDLKGLYDDMNNFRHEKLYGDWATKLKGSKNYAKVAKHSKQGRKKSPVVNGKKGAKLLVEPNAKQEFRVQTFCNAIDH